MNSVKLLLETLGVARGHLKNYSETPSAERAENAALIEKYADTAKIIKMVHRELLSRPICRRLKPWPAKPTVHQGATVRGWKSLNRLDYLAEPRREKVDHGTNRRDGPLKHARKPAWRTVGTRLVELSRPKRSVDMETDDVAKHSRFESKEAWRAHLKKLEVLSAARRTPPSPSSPERVGKPLKAILPHVERLSKPVRRPPDDNEWTYEELYTVKNSALKYIATDRIRKLAVARYPNEKTVRDMNYDPYAKLSKASKYVATERIIELAKPMIRTTPKEDDVKSDPYRVSRKALKARCPSRIKQLARPVVKSQDTVETVYNDVQGTKENKS